MWTATDMPSGRTNNATDTQKRARLNERIEEVWFNLSQHDNCCEKKKNIVSTDTSRQGLTSFRTAQK